MVHCLNGAARCDPESSCLCGFQRPLCSIDLIFFWKQRRFQSHIKWCDINTKSSYSGWIQLVPPVSHLYFLVVFFWLCYCISRNWGWVHSTGKRFLFRNSNDRAGDGFSQVRTQTACKYFNKMIWKKKSLRSVLCIGKHIKLMEITC